MNEKTKRTWIAIVLAALAIVVILGIAVVGSAAFWFRRHINTEMTSTESANVELDNTRARFSGQLPLVEVRESDRPIIHARTVPSTRELQSLRILAYDPQEGKLVRVTLPFWLLR